MKSLQDLKDDLSIAAHGSTVAQTTPTGLCINCKEPALPKCYSDAGKREYIISGLCEACFDYICTEPGDEDEQDDDETAF